MNAEDRGKLEAIKDLPRDFLSLEWDKRIAWLIAQLEGEAEEAYREGVEAIGTEVFRLLGLGRSHEMYTRVDIEMMIALAVRNLRRSKGGTNG